MLPCTWITKLVIDLINCTISLEGTAEPEAAEPSISLVLSFREVGNVRVERYHDFDHVPCFGDLTHIQVEHLGSGRARFRTDTGDAILAFEAAADPSLTISRGLQVNRADLFTGGSLPAT